MDSRHLFNVNRKRNAGYENALPVGVALLSLDLLCINIYCTCMFIYKGTRRGKTKFATVKLYNYAFKIIQSQTCYPLILYHRTYQEHICHFELYPPVLCCNYRSTLRLCKWSRMCYRRLKDISHWLKPLLPTLTHI